MPDASDAARRLEYLTLAELHFDPRNPRFPSARQGVDRTHVLEWLLDSANLPDLMRSIATQGFFPGEPLLVSRRDDGGYTVVEGNRRFAACWLLSHPDDAPTRKRTVAAIASAAEFVPTVLPCLVLPEKEILGFLGYRHITGIQEWSPLAKARYLDRLWQDEDGPGDWDGRLRWLASKIGSRSDYVARLLTALAVFEYIEESNFFDIAGLTEESLSFSLLALALNRPTLASYIGLSSGQDFAFEELDHQHLQNLTGWFFRRDVAGRTTLGESRNVSHLVTVLEDPDARALLESGATLQKAYRTAVDGRESLAEVLNQVLALLSGAADATPNVGESERETVREAIQEICRCLGEVQSRLAELEK